MLARRLHRELLCQPTGLTPCIASARTPANMPYALRVYEALGASLHDNAPQLTQP